MKKKHLRRVVTVVCMIAVLIAMAPSALAASPVLRLGVSSNEVTKLQNRLIALGYADFSEATGYFGAATQTAVIRFQSSHGLVMDGIAGNATQSMLYSSSAKSLILKPGSSSEAVRALQLKLKELGYFSGTGTGHYGAVTLAAVTAFQKARGLAVDGIAGPKTRIQAFSKASAPAAPAPKAAAIADIALAQLGDTYLLGGNGPDKFDCSGLVYYAMMGAGFSVSRLSSAAYSQVSSWAKITGTGSHKKGDLLFFYSESWSSINHMGVYTGDGQFVHASSGQGKVMVSSLSNSYWGGHYAFARRVA